LGAEELLKAVADEAQVTKRGKTPNEVMSLQEQAILANIQELQRQLWKVKSEQEKRDTGEENGAAGEASESMAKHRVIIVANRLPVSGGRDEKTGEWDFRMSSGGLVTALKGSREELNAVWIGWLGQEIPEEDREQVREKLLREYNAVPVFLSDELVNKYYNGFSNDVLWPLFHYMPLPIYQSEAGSDKRFDTVLWDAYKEANVLFADAVAAIWVESDYIWVHDYHLMWLPLELRQRFKHANIGWFLHTPFPSSEIYRILPVRKPLLEALLASDLLGFHTYDYARHFLSACARVLEVDTTPRGLEYASHFMSLGVFPIGIDPEHIAHILQRPAVHARIAELTETFAGRKVLLGVDRLDYIKGMPHKLLALELFLTRHPEWRGKVTLIQVGVPSRTEVPEYQRLSERVNELVGRINGTFGNLEYAPVHYINQSITQEELVAIYNMADVCLVTSLRDGMNLVSYEFVAAQREMPGVHQKDGPGVLVLSEFAGSAQSLSGAIRINPWNTEEVCHAIQQALTLSRAEREIRQHKLSRYVSVNTASSWAKSFVAELRTVCANKPNLSKLPRLPFDLARSAYERARNRLIVADYDGTLTQLQSVPQLATPSPYITNLLDSLSKDPRNTVVIVSGREKRFMDTWLGKLKMALAAEYGFYYRMPEEEEWQTMAPEVDTSWRDIVQPILEYFTERTPGTYIEKKESSLTWHYRDADPNFGSWQAKDMQIQLEDVLSNLPLEIIQGNRMVEVRHQGASKGMVVESVLRYMADPSRGAKNSDTPLDFVFCVGDDRTDEDMFQVLKILRGEAARFTAPSSVGGSHPLSHGGLTPFSSHVGPDLIPLDSIPGGGQPELRPAIATPRSVSTPTAGDGPGRESASNSAFTESRPNPSGMEPSQDAQQKPPVIGEPCRRQEDSHAEKKGGREMCEGGLESGDLASPSLAPHMDHLTLEDEAVTENALMLSSRPCTPKGGVSTGIGRDMPLMARDAKVFTVHVGNTYSQAEYHVESLLDVRRLLRDFASISFRQTTRR
jgi:trehalose 6-phosphate synthase/phosphatase